MKEEIELSSPQQIRVYKRDLDLIREIHKRIYGDTHLTMTELLREAVREGLPRLEERFRNVGSNNGAANETPTKVS